MTAETTTSHTSSSARAQAQTLARALHTYVESKGRRELEPPSRPAQFQLIEPQPAARPRGRAGIDRDAHGLPRLEVNENLEPYKARGLAPDLGILHEMLTSDGTIAGSLALISRTISAARWRVRRYADPSPLEEEVAGFVERFFGLDGSLGWLQGGLAHHLRHACLSLGYGFSAFETLWDAREWQGRQVLVPGRCKWRAPWSVKGWLWRRDDVAGLIQQLPDTERDRRTGLSFPFDGAREIFGARTISIPSQRLLLYTYSPHGLTEAAPEGMSLFRPVWAWWRAKKDTLMSHMSAQERLADGFFVLEEQTLADGRNYPQRSEKDVEDFEYALADHLAGYQSWLLQPAGWKIRHDQPLKNISDPSALLDYLDHQIRLVISGQLLGLGARTSSGLSDSFGQLLFNAIDAIARQLAEVLNGQPGIEHTGLVRRAVLANFELPEGFRWPLLEPVGIRQQDGKARVDAITKALQFMAVRYSPSIEDEVRRMLELSPLTPEERELREALAADLITSTAGQGRQSEEGTQAPVQDPQQADTPDSDEEGS